MARYRRNRTIDTLNDAALRGLIGAARLLPYRWRVPFFGWASARIIAPIAGWRSRIRNNLALVAPDMDPKQARRILRGAPDNAGRSMIEMYSGDDFLDAARALPLTGPGVAAITAARDAGRPMVFATAISAITTPHGPPWSPMGSNLRLCTVNLPTNTCTGITSPRWPLSAGICFRAINAGWPGWCAT